MSTIGDEWTAQRFVSNPDSFVLRGPGGLECDVEAGEYSEQANFLRALALVLIGREVAPPPGEPVGDPADSD